MARNSDKEFSLVRELLNQANIDSHLSFVRDVLSRYPFDPEEKAKRESDVCMIQQKSESHDLTLCVVGEFSSGKSTLINALLRDNLLEADMIQGTTNAACVLRHADGYNVLVKYKDGAEQSLKTKLCRAPSREEVKLEIARVTEDDKLAQTIQSVTVEHPSPSLEHLVIIDTPGTNALERWHEDVTVDTLVNTADAAIILTSADRPMPQSLIDFITANLLDVVSKCVFMVTKFDTIRKHERENTIHFIKERIRHSFGVEHPIVLPYASLYVLREESARDGEVGQVFAEDMRALSFASETTLFRVLQDNKAMIQLQKMMALLENLYDGMRNTMAKQQAAYQAQHEIIQADRIPDRKDFLHNETNAAQMKLFVRLEQAMPIYSVLFTIEMKKYKEIISDQFNKIMDKRVLGQYAQGLGKKLSNAANAITKAYIPDISEKISAATEAVWNDFFVSFCEKYRRLAIHADAGSAEALDLESMSTSLAFPDTFSGNLFALATQYQSIDAISQHFPFVYSIIDMFKGSLNSIRAKQWAEMVKVINTSIDSIGKYAKTVTDELHQGALSQLKERIVRCVEQYEKLIERVDKQDRDMLERIEALVRDIDTDVDNLLSRQRSIHGFKVQIEKVAMEA